MRRFEPMKPHLSLGKTHGYRGVTLRRLMFTSPMWSPTTDANATCEANKPHFSFGETAFGPQTEIPGLN